MMSHWKKFALGRFQSFFGTRQTRGFRKKSSVGSNLWMVAEILGRIWSEEPQLFHSYGSYGRFIPIYQLFWFVLPRSHPTSRDPGIPCFEEFYHGKPKRPALAEEISLHNLRGFMASRFAQSLGSPGTWFVVSRFVFLIDLPASYRF